MEAGRSVDLALTLDCSEILTGEELTVRLSSLRKVTRGDCVLLKNIGSLDCCGSRLVIRQADLSLLLRGRRLQLPVREFQIVASLAANGGTMSSVMLGHAVWPSLPTKTSRAFTKVYVRRIRVRLGADRTILRTTNRGYQLTSPFELQLR